MCNMWACIAALCGSQQKQRFAVKSMLREMDERHPEMRIKPSILSSLSNVRTTHLLDPELNALYRELDLEPDSLVEADAEPILRVLA